MAVVVLTREVSLADQFLTEVRDRAVQQDRRRFRENMENLGSIMAYEISKRIEYQPVETATSLGTARGRILKNSPVLITLLRAGLPFYAGFQKLFGQSEAGFVGIQRVEGQETLTIKMDYSATPRLEDQVVILVDPMLATGRSATDSIAEILRNGTPRHIHIASLIATQPGIQQVEKNVRISHTIWTFAIDEELNDKSYIVPGLGDAGDLSFGEKL